MIVIADTGPVNYLVLIGEIELVHTLYGTVLIPSAVRHELLDARAPAVVGKWASTLPLWAQERSPKDASRFGDLGPGEREAISLALETKADFLLIDEPPGRSVAIQNNVPVKGTLGLLEEADIQCVPNFDFVEALRKLQRTTIFVSESLVQDALNRHLERQQTLEQSQEHDDGTEQNQQRNRGIER